MEKNLILVAGACVFKETRRGDRWLLVKQDTENDVWEIPKIVARKTESSARAAIRMMAELGGMHAKVLEEVGRAGGSATVGNQVVPQRYIYYLLVQKSAGEVLGFKETKWLEYAKALRLLSSKREKIMLKKAKEELKRWRKERKAKAN